MSTTNITSPGPKMAMSPMSPMPEISPMSSGGIPTPNSHHDHNNNTKNNNINNNNHNHNHNNNSISMSPYQLPLSPIVNHNNDSFATSATSTPNATNGTFHNSTTSASKSITNGTTNGTTTTTTTTTSTSTSTRKKKLNAVLGDGSFESIMKQRATKRREKDEQCIAELRYSISNMDQNLTQEIKRRIESVKTLEDQSMKFIKDMEESLRNVMVEKMDIIRYRIENVEDKVQELNGRLEEEKNSIPKDISLKGREVKDMLQTFQEEFSIERRERLTREGRIMKQLTDHAHEMRNAWEEESRKREECVQELRGRLEEHENNRAKADEGFESLITRELEALRNDVKAEKMERMNEDDEIVEALNRYTENLQNSLSALTMTGV